MKELELIEAVISCAKVSCPSTEIRSVGIVGTSIEGELYFLVAYEKMTPSGWEPIEEKVPLRDVNDALKLYEHFYVVAEENLKLRGDEIISVSEFIESREISLLLQTLEGTLRRNAILVDKDWHSFSSRGLACFFENYDKFKPMLDRETLLLVESLSNAMEREILYCHVCEKEICHIEDLFHFSGIINRKKTGHIHVCEGCVSTHNLNTDIDFDELKKETK